MALLSMNDSECRVHCTSVQIDLVWASGDVTTV